MTCVTDGGQVDAAELYEVLGLDLRPGIGGEEGVLKLLEAHPKVGRQEGRQVA